MATNDDHTKSSLMELLEALINCKIDSEERTNEEPCSQSDGFISRGFNSDKPNNRKMLQHEILQKTKRNKMAQNVNLLKQLIGEQREVESLKSLAKILNEVTTHEQKSLFIQELNAGRQSSNSECSSFLSDGRDSDSQDQTFFSDSYPGQLKSRSSVPQGSSGLFDSIGLKSLDTPSNSPPMTISITPLLMAKYNSSELYVIQKGIIYCRVLLKSFFQNKDKAIIRELKSRNLLSLVLNEYMGDSKSYLANLADNFPKSYEEILFILKEDKDAILRSQIFVLLAQKDLKLLNDFIVQLVRYGVDKHELSKSCDESHVNGITVSNVIERARVDDNSQLKAHLSRFLNLYKST